MLEGGEESCKGNQQHGVGQGRGCAKPNCLLLIPCAVSPFQSLWELDPVRES